jgi:heme/copper-type cytochrome/quinol oxidase subunit 3
MSSQTPIATGRSSTGIPTGKLAVWWIIVSEIVIFGGLIASYLLYRFRFDHWSGFAGQTDTRAGAFNTLVLLTSSLFVVLAHQAAQRKDTKGAFKYLWFTIGGGFIFLIVKAYEYTTKIAHGYTFTTDNFWSFYYTATGLHGFHVVAGMVIMGIISFDVRKGNNLHRVENIGIYWHFVDLVWIFLFPLLYIAK